MTYGGISPRVGLAFELTPLFFLDVNVNYNHVFSEDTGALIPSPNYDWIGLNVGVLYTINE